MVTESKQLLRERTYGNFRSFRQIDLNHKNCNTWIILIVLISIIKISAELLWLGIQ